MNVSQQARSVTLNTSRQYDLIEQVVNVRNCLPAQVDFSSLSSFTCTVKQVDLSEFLSCL